MATIKHTATMARPATPTKNIGNYAGTISAPPSEAVISAPANNVEATGGGAASITTPTGVVHTQAGSKHTGNVGEAMAPFGKC